MICARDRPWGIFRCASAGDVDADDFGIFMDCMSGANVQGDPSCADQAIVSSCNT